MTNAKQILSSTRRDNLENLVLELRRRVAALEQRKLEVTSLAEIAPDLGDMRGGRFITQPSDAEEAEPTDPDFTGTFHSGDGEDFPEGKFNFGGVNKGKLQAGFSIDGTLLGGGGAVVVNEAGIQLGAGAAIYSSSGGTVNPASLRLKGWNALSTAGANNVVRAIAYDSQGNVYAGGDFTIIGGVSANRIAKWDGTAWSALGSGFSAKVFSIVVDTSDNVYASGEFTNPVQVWNGSTWTALSSGATLPDIYKLLLTSTGTLYAGGYGGIFQWSGSSWSALPNPGSGNVFNDMIIDPADNSLVACGYWLTFSPMGNGLARWNGSSWSGIGGGIDGSGLSGVGNALLIVGGNLYVTGPFTSVGGVAANRIAKWNGTTWSALGTGLSAEARTLANMGSTIYAGGDFLTAGGLSAPYLAAWDGANWAAVDGSANASVYRLLSVGYSLYAGGSFTSIGSKTINRIAVYLGGYVAYTNNPVAGALAKFYSTDGRIEPAGTAAQASELLTIGGLAPANDDVIQRKAGKWVNRTMAQLAGDLTTLAPLASPALTGNPTAPTPAVSDNDTSIATTAFVMAQRGDIPSGATLPASPLANQLFMHTPTGRRILMLYTNSAWNPLYSFGAMTIYVDGTNGTDAADKGTGGGTSAYKTLSYMWSQLPAIFYGTITCNVAAGTYSESLSCGGKTAGGPYYIMINGTVSTTDSGTVTIGVQGTGATPGSIQDTSKTWTVNGFVGYYAYSSSIGYRVITSNTADTVTIAGSFNATPSGAYSIVAPSVIIDGGAARSTCVTINSKQEVRFQFIKFTNSTGTDVQANTANYVVLQFNYCQFAPANGKLPIWIDNGSTIFYWCDFANNGGYSVSLGLGSHNFTACNWHQVTGTKAGQGVVCSGGKVFITGGCNISNYAYGVFIQLNASCDMFQAASTGYHQIHDNGIGLQAQTGGMIMNTANNQYTANTTNENAVAASFGYID